MGTVRASTEKINVYIFRATAEHRVFSAQDRRGRGEIAAGMMPMTHYSQLMRVSDMCCAEIPRWIRMRLASFGDDVESIRAFGLEVVTQLCERLLAGGAPGLHFYSLNQANATLAICRNLGKLAE